MELKLEHLAGYLPYRLKGIYIEDNVGIETMISLSTNVSGTFVEVITNHDAMDIHTFKPILRPLSDLTKEIEVNGEKFVPIDELWKYHNFSSMRWDDIDKDPTRYPFTIVQALLSWHFDIYNLIENGLAIDINTLTPSRPQQLTK